MGTTTLEPKGATVSAIDQDQRQKRDPLEEPRSILEAALVFNPGVDESPRLGFDIEYMNYQADWLNMLRIKNSDPARAMKIAWGICNHNVLQNTKVMVFFIRGAYMEYATLMNRATDSHEQHAEWGNLHDKLARLETNLIEMMGWSDDMTRQAIDELVRSDSFKAELEQIFALQKTKTDPQVRWHNSNLRKWIFYDCKQVFGKSRMICNACPAAPVNNRRVATEAERKKALEIQEAKRATRRAQDAAFREACKGPAGSKDNRGPGHYSKRAANDPKAKGRRF